MSGLHDIQENNEQILNDIKSLQQIEQEIFNTLETNPNLTVEEQKKMVDKMNQLSTMRVNLYKTLSNTNIFYKGALNASVGSLKQQAVAIGIVENELNSAKKRLEILEEERNNKIRLVQINTYFGDKYAEHSELMKIVIFTLIPIIFLVILYNTGLISNTIYYILLIIISLIGAVFFWRRFASIIIRDNMNYQEYDWAFNPNSVPLKMSDSTSDPWSSNIFGTCIGDYCCAEYTVYDASLNKCIPNIGSIDNKSANPMSSPTTLSPTAVLSTSSNVNETVGDKVIQAFTTQSMIDKILTKKQPFKNKIDYDLREPKPYNI
jgi:hypothetical protein